MGAAQPCKSPISRSLWPTALLQAVEKKRKVSLACILALSLFAEEVEASQELFCSHPPQHGHVWTAGSTRVAWKHRVYEAFFPAVGWGQWAETTHDVTVVSLT